MELRPRHLSARPVVLILCGQDETRALYAITLSAMGFDVMAGKSGGEAYDRAWQAHPDIIVFEWAGGQADAWELLAHLKDHPRTRDIPLVIVTSDVRSPEPERAWPSSRDAFFLKPCLPEELAMELRHVLSHSITDA